MNSEQRKQFQPQTGPTEYWKSLPDSEKMRLLLDANHKTYLALVQVQERLRMYEPPEPDEE